MKYLVVLFSSLIIMYGIFSSALGDIVMNFVGVFLWIAVGAVALHYWGGYQGEHQFQFVFAERQVTIKKIYLDTFTMYTTTILIVTVDRSLSIKSLIQ